MKLISLMIIIYFLIVIQGPGRKIESYKTDKQETLDSLFKATIDSTLSVEALMKDSKFLEIRREGITFYVEKK